MTRLEEMKALATEEAVKLKQHATIKERSLLNFRTFDSRMSHTCIYGQMTGYCSGKRANELIRLCCTKVYNVEKVELANEGVLNGSPHKIKDGCVRHALYQSPIEVLIYEENGGKEAAGKLIAFLKDETQTLEL